MCDVTLLMGMPYGWDGEAARSWHDGTTTTRTTKPQLPGTEAVGLTKLIYYTAAMAGIMSVARWTTEAVPVGATCRLSAGGCCQEDGYMLVGLASCLQQILTTTFGPQGLWGESDSQGGGRVLIIRPRLARPAGRTTSWNAI